HRAMCSAIEGPPRELATLNLEFHRAIRESTANPYFERFLRQVEHAVRRLGTTTYDDTRRARERLAEHEGIIDAIAAGDAVPAGQGPTWACAAGIGRDRRAAHRDAGWGGRRRSRGRGGRLHLRRSSIAVRRETGEGHNENTRRGRVGPRSRLRPLGVRREEAV